MLLFFIGTLLAIVLGVFALQFFARLHVMNAVTMSQRPAPGASRYRPMLRLLSDEDLGTGGFSRPVLRKIRAQRRLLFRAYLRCLTKDYGRLLMGIRMVMVNSGVDRPDLARALARNQVFFALAVCRIELRLQLHAAGLGNVDVSGLVEAMETLRIQVNLLSPAPLPVR
jgi:hypothetical protein